MGDKISACIAWAACAICSDSDGPGNDSRRRPASHGEVEPRGVKAVSLNGDSWRAMYWLEIHSLIDKSRSYNLIIQCLQLMIKKGRVDEHETQTFMDTRVRQSKL